MSDNSPSLQPWDRQPGEPSLWYARFDRYRLRGPERSILGVYNEPRIQRGLKPGKSVNTHWWSKVKDWDWRERAEAWDERERQRIAAVRAREVVEAAQRHTQVARVLQNTALKRLQAFNPEDLSPSQVLRYLVDAAKMERLALIEAARTEVPKPAERGTDDIERLANANIQELSDEELVRIIVAGGGVVAEHGAVAEGGVGIPPPGPGMPGMNETMKQPAEKNQSAR